MQRTTALLRAAQTHDVGHRRAKCSGEPLFLFGPSSSWCEAVRRRSPSAPSTLRGPDGASFCFQAKLRCSRDERYGRSSCVHGQQQLSHSSPAASSVQYRAPLDSTPAAMSSSRPRSTPVEVYEGLCQHCLLPLRVTISVVTEGPNAGKRVCHVVGAHGPRTRSRSRPRSRSPRLELEVQVEAPEPVAPSTPTEIEEDSLPPVAGQAPPVGGPPPAGGDAPGPALQDMPLHELAQQW